MFANLRLIKSFSNQIVKKGKKRGFSTNICLQRQNLLGLFCRGNHKGRHGNDRNSRIPTACSLYDTNIRDKKCKNHTAWTEGKTRARDACIKRTVFISLPPLHPSWAIEINCLWSNQQKLCKLKSPHPTPAQPPTRTTLLPHLQNISHPSPCQTQWTLRVMSCRAYSRLQTCHFLFPQRGTESKERPSNGARVGQVAQTMCAHKYMFSCTHSLVQRHMHAHTCTHWVSTPSRTADISPHFSKALLSLLLPRSLFLIKKPLEERAAWDHMTSS